MIVLSVCHSRLAYGAKTANGLAEYEIGKRATKAAYDSLYTECIPCAIMEFGLFTREGQMPHKQRMIRGADLAVEIHCNANEDSKQNYSETIYYPESPEGRHAAEHIVDAVSKGFSSSNHGWPTRGARGDATLFFLKTSTPAVIVEGVFVSNPDQAAFLESDNGPETYGLLVAEGVKQWWLSRSLA